MASLVERIFVSARQRYDKIPEGVVMTISHKPDKTLDDLSTQFQLPFGKHWLDVYIWKNRQGLMDNVRHNGCGFIGCYMALPERKKKGLFGEIHLILGEIGAGYVAHELQHFILDFCAEFVPVINKRRQEKVAYAMSNMTTLFWRNFYEKYEVEKNGLICPQC